MTKCVLYQYKCIRCFCVISTRLKIITPFLLVFDSSIPLIQFLDLPLLRTSVANYLCSASAYRRDSHCESTVSHLSWKIVKSRLATLVVNLVTGLANYRLWIIWTQKYYIPLKRWGLKRVYSPRQTNTLACHCRLVLTINENCQIIMNLVGFKAESNNSQRNCTNVSNKTTSITQKLQIFYFPLFGSEKPHHIYIWVPRYLLHQKLRCLSLEHCELTETIIIKIWLLIFLQLYYLRVSDLSLKAHLAYEFVLVTINISVK